MSGFAGWVGGQHTFDEMKRQLRLMVSKVTEEPTQSVYLPVGAIIAPKQPLQILQNGTAAIALQGEVYWHHKRMPKHYKLSLEEILEAYLHQGAQCLNTFQGEFALAIILAEHNEVFIACDKMSSYPIYYANQNGHFVFSTTMQALTSHMAIETELNPQSQYDLLSHHFIPSPNTIYKSIARVQPGHYVLHRKMQTLNVPYWQPASFPKKSIGFAKKKSLLMRHLQRAVVKHKEKNVGAFLSGGLDSSTVAGLMQQEYQRPIKAFTIGFDQQPFDESDYAKLVAKHFDLQHHHRTLTADDLMKALPELFNGLCQPFGNASLVGAYFCAQMAKEQGLDGLLAGDGGDELFGGNTRYQRHYWFSQYKRIPKALRWLGVEGPLAAFNEDTAIQLIRKAKKFNRLATLPIIQREKADNLLDHFGINEIFEQSYLSEIESNLPYQRLNNCYQEAQGKSWLNKLLCSDLRWILAENDIQKVRFAARAHDLEVYFPMLDEPLVRFALKLPDHDKMGKRGLRSFYKRALSDLLPKALMKKKKHGFGVPFGLWLTQHRPLQNFCYDSISTLKKTDIVKSSFIDLLLNKLLFEHPNYYGVLIWELFCLSYWLEQHPHKPLAVQEFAIDKKMTEIS